MLQILQLHRLPSKRESLLLKLSSKKQQISAANLKFVNVNSRGTAGIRELYSDLL